MNTHHAFEVRMHDVDHAGVMFFARLFVHAHDAYEDFMASLGLGLDDLIGDRVRLPVVHASADYLGPLRHGEKISVSLQVERVGRTSFTIGYVFHCGGETRATLRTVHVHLDAQDGSPAPIPEAMCQRLKNNT